MLQGMGHALNHKVATGGVLVVLAGGTGVLATQSSATGPILAFGAALIVAVIASLTATANVRKQLAAETQRHKESLDAEKMRLAQTLEGE